MEAAAAAAKAERESEQRYLRAASMGLLAEVEALVAEGVSVAAVDEERAGALHLAAARDHAAVISFLLSHGADADAEDAAGRSALHVAALSGALGAAEALLAAGAWVDAQDGGDATPLLHAARSGGGALVRVLLRAGGSHATRDARGLSPLAHAVANDAPEAAQALLAAGADASESPRDASLLHLAAATGAVRCARLLLARPGGSAALRDTRNAMRWTPLHAAAAAARPALVELLLGWREGGTVDVDARSADGKTALDCCACAPPEAADAAAECERLLLARGARRGSAIATASSPPAAATARRGDPARAAAEAFAALSRDAQSARLDRWADAAAAPGASDAPPPDFPGPGAVAFSHVAAAGVLRLDAALDDVTARMLDDDDWQDLMASPAVRAAVEEVQADANAVRKWGENAACMAALGELRKLQAFCKPKGLRTSLPALLRRADNTADGARERMRRKQDAARNALETARGAILAHARGEAPPAAEASPPPTPTLAAAPPSAEAKPRRDEFSEIQPDPRAPPPLVTQNTLNALRKARDAAAAKETETALQQPFWRLVLSAWPGWAAFWEQMRWVLLRQVMALVFSVAVMYALGFVGEKEGEDDAPKAAQHRGFEDL